MLGHDLGSLAVPQLLVGDFKQIKIVSEYFCLTSWFCSSHILLPELLTEIAP